MAVRERHIVGLAGPTFLKASKQVRQTQLEREKSLIVAQGLGEVSGNRGLALNGP